MNNLTNTPSTPTPISPIFSAFLEKYPEETADFLKKNPDQTPESIEKNCNKFIQFIARETIKNIKTLEKKYQPPYRNDYTIEPRKIMSISTEEFLGFCQSTSTPEVFSKIFENPDYTLDSALWANGETALHLAAIRGNVDLIDYIVKLGGKKLLFIHTTNGNSPLHHACVCEDKEAGYLAAKKLIQLGSPVNIGKKFNWPDDDSRKMEDIQKWEGVKDIWKTPLESALYFNYDDVINSKILKLLVRMGGIARKGMICKEAYKNYQKLKIDNKKILDIYKNATLFKLGSGFPKEINNNILYITADLTHKEIEKNL